MLDALHHVTLCTSPHLSVLGALRFPLKANDWDAIRLGKSVFLHKDVPDGWWDGVCDARTDPLRAQTVLGQEQPGLVHLERDLAHARTDWR